MEGLGVAELAGRRNTVAVITASLFQLAGPDLIVILVIVLLLFGAKKGWRNHSQELGKELSKFADEKNQFISNSELTVIAMAFVMFLLIVVWLSSGR